MVRATGGYGQSSCGGGSSSLGYLLGGDSPAKAPAQAAQEPVAEPAGPAGPTNITYDQYTANEIRKMTLKDLRVELRARGLSPAGGKEALEERLLESVAAPPPPVAAAPVATAPALEEPVSAPGEVDGVSTSVLSFLNT
ncbi:hypothetical protein CYMTET_37582 [Cymbomonas tetramitiformis]|uniref:SAP domain-containing protein n=1 Tax=Cymbomonas tetramitiformis TaxID=36881 RepID=A0AAE0CFU6_9CHLO|nr:hypothetical protein CYMTET_37582 [Cymbomonas tetramitiformis]